MYYEDKSKEELIEELKRRDRLSQQQSINDNETVLKAILESTADGIIVLDHSSKILHINKRFIQLWKIPDELLDEQDARNLAEQVKDQLVDPERFMSEIDSLMNNRTEYKDTLYFKNGRIYERYCHPLIINNLLSGTVFSFRDITQKAMLEKELMRSQKLYRKLIELLPDGVMVYKDGRLFLVNRAATKLLKQEKSALLGRPGGTAAKLHPDYREEALTKMNKLLSSETTLDYSEEKLILTDGSIIDIETGSFSFKNEDQLFITTIVRDITERKRIHLLEKTVSEKSELLKEAQEYNLLKTQLFSTISHELKTPLNIIFGSVQLLEKLNGNNILNKYTKIMKQNCYRLLRLINNLIDLNKIEIGFCKLELHNSDIVKIIEDITLSVVDYTNSKGIELVFDTDVEEKIAACDAEKLERVMLNLLSNAIKFTEPGGNISVNIFDNNDSIIISVKDSGVGIPEDMLDKIFETFRQVDSSFRRKAEGSGIGLSLVKSLIEMHGGTVCAKSKYGSGSEFIIELPVYLIEKESTSMLESAVTLDSKIETVHIEFSDIYS
jgi:PAS domain S-box-containing protein